MLYICKQIKYNSIDGFLRNLACKVYEKSQIKQRFLKLLLVCEDFKLYAQRDKTLILWRHKLPPPPKLVNWGVDKVEASRQIIGTLIGQGQAARTGSYIREDASVDSSSCNKSKTNWRPKACGSFAHPFYSLHYDEDFAGGQMPNRAIPFGK